MYIIIVVLNYILMIVLLHYIDLMRYYSFLSTIVNLFIIEKIKIYLTIYFIFTTSIHYFNGLMLYFNNDIFKTLTMFIYF